MSRPTFGTSLAHHGVLASPDTIETMARRVEELGFETVWVADHVVLPRNPASPYPYNEAHRLAWDTDLPCFEALTTLAWAGAVTRRVRLGLTVLILPMRNTVITAKQLASIDVLSGGRLLFGVGVGWLEEEFAALGVADRFHVRGRYTDEQLQAMKELWSSPNPAFHGEFIQFEDLGFMPKPVQRPHPPIWIGGNSRPAIRRAARLGDGWHVTRAGTRTLGDGVAYLRQQAEQAGRDPAGITVSWKAAVQRSDAPTGLDIDKLGELGVALRGTADEVAAQLRRLHALGVSDFLLDYQAGDLGALLDGLEWIAREVVPRVE